MNIADQAQQIVDDESMNITKYRQRKQDERVAWVFVILAGLTILSAVFAGIVP